MQITDFFQTANNRSADRSHASVKLLIGLQLLMAVMIIAGVYLASQHLRQVALDNMSSHTEEQTHNLTDRLTQSLDLLHLHLESLISDHPDAAIDVEVLGESLHALQRKLSYIRSISVVDVGNRIFLSTWPANINLKLDLGPLLPANKVDNTGFLRFGRPWYGRDFAHGQIFSTATDGQDDSGFFPVVLTLPETPQWTFLIAVNSDYFINLAPEHNEPGALAHRVMLDDGILAFSTANTDVPGSVLLAPEMLEEIRHNHLGSTYRHDQSGKLQLNTYRASHNYPWFVHSSASEDFILAKWQQDTRKLWQLSAATLFVMLLVSGLLTRRVQRVLSFEELLQEKNQLAANVFLFSNDLIAITDHQRNIIAVNPAYETITGFAAHEVLGRPPGSLVYNPKNRSIYAHVWQHMTHQDHWQGEIYEQHKDGHLVSGWLQVNAVRDTAGAICNYVTVFMDLSRLYESEASVLKLSQAVEQSPSSIIMTTPEGTIEYANPQFLQATGYDREEVIGANPRILKSGLTPLTTYHDLWDKITSGQVWHGELINRRKNGQIFHEMATISPIHNHKGELSGYLAIKHDISKEQEAEQRMLLAANVIANTAEGVLICDANSIVIDINPAFSRITGYAASEIFGQHPDILSNGNRNEAALADMWTTLKTSDTWKGEFYNRHKDGHPYIAGVSVSTIRDQSGKPSNYVAVFSDITESKLQQDQLQHQAHFDHLTGLANRTLLGERLIVAMNRAREQQHWLAVCFLDLDGFKLVNDTYGHDAGDEVLISIAQRLKDAVRGSDTIARLGGDEFVLLLSPVRNLQECEMIASRILQSVAKPVLFGQDQETGVTGSMGITLYPLDDSDDEQLLRHADQAMYEAKQAGRNRYVIAAESGARA